MKFAVRSWTTRSAWIPLQELLNRQNLYIMNIQDIFSGKVPIDSVQTLDSLTAAREDTLMERTKREEEFRRQYEENENII